MVVVGGRLCPGPDVSPGPGAEMGVSPGTPAVVCGPGVGVGVDFHLVYPPRLARALSPVSVEA